MAERVASIDIGTNSVLLLIAEAGPTGPRPVLERATITRLGEGVDRTRRLAAGARERTLSCLAAYAREIAEQRVDAVAAVGTSALRDCADGVEFTREIRALLGTEPQVIDGGREAALTFRGALSGLALAGPVTVFDVGGGSTEIVHGTRGVGESRVESAVSLDIGSVRLFERHVRSDPPSSTELALATRDIERALSTAPRASQPSALVGVAGTVTTLASIALGLAAYDASRVHGHVLTQEDVAALVEKLARLPLAERRALRGLDPRRADVIVTGSLIVEHVLRHANASELTVSDRGVRWGLAEELLARAP